MDEDDIERDLRAEMDREQEQGAPDAQSAREPCDRCGDFHPVDDMIDLEGDATCEDCMEAIFDAPWSPGLVAGLSFFLGFGAAGVVSELNRKRMGYDTTVFAPALGWIAAFAVVILLVSFLPEGVARGAGIGVNMAGLFYFKQRDASRFAAFQESGGQKGSTLAAIGIGLVATVVSFGLIFVAGGALGAFGIY